MSTWLRAGWVAAVMLAPMLPVEAADDAGNFAVKGIGTTSCRDYLAARETGGDEYLLYGGWIGGYVTAFNQLAPQTFDLLPWQSVDTLTRMLASACEKTPDTLFAAVLSRLATLVQPQRIASPSAPVRAGEGPGGVTLYAEALRRTQERLAALGLFEGSPDGAWDERTREALSRFQQANGLQATGVPDQVTLFVLNYPPAGGN